MRGLRPSLRLSPRTAGREGTESRVIQMALGFAQSNLEFEKMPMILTKLNQIKVPMNLQYRIYDLRSLRTATKPVVCERWLQAMCCGWSLAPQHSRAPGASRTGQSFQICKKANDFDKIKPN